jgi:hypothetical protein
MTRKLDYAAFCQGAIMTFDSKLRHYDVRHNGVHQSGMRQNTIPPQNHTNHCYEFSSTLSWHLNSGFLLAKISIQEV